jgi:predicted  nucleic acid-binding Zn-ribbon protein
MAKSTASTDVSTEEKLKALFHLQTIDSEIDKIRIIRGELPLEVQDLEDEIEGLETRVNKLSDDLKDTENTIAEKKNLIKDAQALIKKYEGQQGKVRNNREFDSLSKEIEFQTLEIQLAEKRIKEFKASLSSKQEVIDESAAVFEGRKKDLELKKNELKEIVEETQKEEEDLMKKSKKAQSVIDERLLNAYNRLRTNARNGLAVVAVERDACGGCYNKIPPQRQLDIKSHKKIIVCEHCGRVLTEPESQED